MSVRGMRKTQVTPDIGPDPGRDVQNGEIEIMTVALAGAAINMQIMKADIQTGKEASMTRQQAMKRKGIAQQLKATTETTIRQGTADMQSRDTEADSTATESINRRSNMKQENLSGFNLKL